MEDILIQRKTRSVAYDLALPNAADVTKLYQVLDANPNRVALLLGSSIDAQVFYHFGIVQGQAVSYVALAQGHTPIVLSLMLHGAMVTMPIQARIATAGGRIHVVETILTSEE